MLSLLIGASVPEAPDTLNPNGIAIIHNLGHLTVPGYSCGIGPLQGALCHKSKFAVKLPGGTGACGPFPPDPPVASY